MAELITTEQEQEAYSFLDWDDEALGRAVKKLAVVLADRDGKEAIKRTACTAILVSSVVDSGSHATVVDLHNVYCPDGNGVKRDLGDWRVIAEPLEDLREPSLTAAVDDAISAASAPHSSE